MVHSATDKGWGAYRFAKVHFQVRYLEPGSGGLPHVKWPFTIPRSLDPTGCVLVQAVWQFAIVVIFGGLWEMTM